MPLDETIDWIIGDEATSRLAMAVEGSPLVSGTAVAEYYRFDGLIKEWLQSDGETWAASLYQFPLPLVGNGFERTFEIPDSDIEEVSEKLTHSAGNFVIVKHVIGEEDDDGGGGGAGDTLEGDLSIVYVPNDIDIVSNDEEDALQVLLENEDTTTLELSIPTVTTVDLNGPVTVESEC